MAETVWDGSREFSPNARPNISRDRETIDRNKYQYLSDAALHSPPPPNRGAAGDTRYAHVSILRRADERYVGLCVYIHENYNYRFQLTSVHFLYPFKMRTQRNCQAYMYISISFCLISFKWEMFGGGGVAEYRNLIVSATWKSLFLRVLDFLLFRDRHSGHVSVYRRDKLRCVCVGSTLMSSSTPVR